MDRQICPEGHILASRGSPNDGFFFLHAVMRMQEPLIVFSIIDIFTGDDSGIRTGTAEVHS